MAGWVVDSCDLVLQHQDIQEVLGKSQESVQPLKEKHMHFAVSVQQMFFIKC